MRAQLVPGQMAPDLRFQTLGHGLYDLARDAPPGGTLVIFHRGQFCKWGRNALKEIDDRIGDFAIRGLRVVALSVDSAETTALLQQGMQLIRLPLGHSANPDAIGSAWAPYITTHSTEDGAPPRHFEPAQIWVKSDGTIGLCAYQSAPNLWPDATSTLRAIDTTLRHPARGADRG